MKSRFSLFTLLAAILLAPLAALHAADLGGVKVTINGNQGPAVVTAELMEKFSVKDAQGSVISTKPGKADGADALRFDVPPREASYSIGAAP